MRNIHKALTKMEIYGEATHERMNLRSTSTNVWTVKA